MTAGGAGAAGGATCCDTHQFVVLIVGVSAGNNPYHYIWIRPNILSLCSTYSLALEDFHMLSSQPARLLLIANKTMTAKCSSHL